MQDKADVKTTTKSPMIGLLTREVFEDACSWGARGMCLVKLLRGKGHIKLADVSVETAINCDAVSIELGTGIKLPMDFTLCQYKLTVDKVKAQGLDIQNKVIVNYQDKYYGRILYSMADLKKGQNRNEKVFIENGTAMYFRQSAYNSLGITVRPSNYYDTAEGQAFIKKAYNEAKKLKDKDFILMYEKECSRYEESASVLYEKLIDEGYTNIYYVVNSDNPRIQNLDEKYRKNLVERDSLEHLVRFFATEVIVATESTEHALKLRAASKLVMDKVKSPELKYVFLQHGVMYMVSLNSEMRTGFRNSNYKLHRVVVSSEEEARHFEDLGGMNRENLYITGLAKFDRSIRNSDADKIVIMPTWRRWETNQARSDLESTGYYKLVETIFRAVPDELKEKTVILPHPLMLECFKGDSELKEHILIADSYDDVLQNCNLLITDYSSIAYDAFYRGANVIFCWQDKDDCMEHYGEGTFLMLNEDNVFGDVCMAEDEIRAAIERRYNKLQEENAVQKYRKIVQFNDNLNSDRIINAMKKDGLLK